LQRILFIPLSVFQFTGGLEKFNRCFCKALNTIHQQDKAVDYTVFSVHDTTADAAYVNPQKFIAGLGNRWKSVWSMIQQARKADTIIIGHSNLALPALIIKKLFPKKKYWLVAHGIEVWNASPTVLRFLKLADKILAVSQFTKSKLVAQGINAAAITVFHNTIDPYFQQPQQFDKPAYLQQRYQLQSSDTVLFALTRLNSNEQYKGYDTVIKAMPALLQQHPNLHFFIAGKADAAEKERVEQLVAAAGLQQKVKLVGFIPDNELTDHFLLADAFAMPSYGEGFGIVFIEAMACGLPVLAGNKDGSTDALQNGALGILVNPFEESSVQQGLQQLVQQVQQGIDKTQLQQQVNQQFGFTHFTTRLAALLRA
jgi:phosphatidyl-myo-inositol dimannoside synthase